MKNIWWIAIILIFLGGAVYLYLRLTASPIDNKINFTPMQITSPAFSHHDFIPSQYTCEGENINPPLQITDIPENAKSLVLIVDDPDAPGRTFVHWTVWNISPQVNSIPENSVPQGGVEGITDFGRPGYGGPCPPSGVHRYFFKVYALDTLLELPSSATKSDIEKAMEGHILAHGELVGLYEKKGN